MEVFIPVYRAELGAEHLHICTLYSVHVRPYMYTHDDLAFIIGGGPAQLFSTNAFSANTFSLNVLSTFTPIHSQSIVNTDSFFTYFLSKKQIFRKNIGFIRIKPIVWE